MKYILTDKKRIGIIMTLLLVAGLFLGCSSKEETENNAPSMENQLSQVEEQSNSASTENNDIEWKDKLEIDFSYDYSEDIKTDVDEVVSGSVSLQKELENIENIIQKYTPLTEAAQTQGRILCYAGKISKVWFICR